MYWIRVARLDSQFLATLEEDEFDQERATDHRRSTLGNQVQCRPGRAPGCDQVVDGQHAGPGVQRVGVHLDPKQPDANVRSSVSSQPVRINAVARWRRARGRAPGASLRSADMVRFRTRASDDEIVAFAPRRGPLLLLGRL